jgi:iron complex outermembrane receptor protein
MKWFRLSLVAIFLINSIQAIALPQSASVSGQVVDDLTSLPISDVQVTLVVEEATILSRTDANGKFRFDGIAPGTYTLRFVRDTYKMLERVIDVARNLPALTVSLKSRTVQLEEILVTPDDDALANLEKTTDLALSEARLDEKMGITIADALSDEVGIAQRSMGRAVARPVIRGMGGDRLLILEDGERTGDKSASAADHAVAIDPSTAKNIKVIRGPASLIYGSNTLGGVVNVKRETIPKAVPNHPTVDLKFQSESVNSGIAAITGLTVPVGDFAWRLAWNRRYANDTHTPVGVLENTSLSNTSFSSGASVVKNWGHVGVSGGRYRSDYGIPGSPEGHISGVNIALDRQRYEGNVEYAFNDSYLEKLKLHSTHTRYQHQEFESNKTLGVEFVALTSNVSALAHLEGDAIAGMWGEYRDHSTDGFYWTPHTREISIAGFYFNQRQFNDFTLQGAIRYEIKRVEPFKTGTVTRAGMVRRRNFGGVSGAVSGIYHWSDGLKTGATMMKAFRAPGIEELFSDGPHLAAYSYEIGNSELDTENGWGTEAFLRYSVGRVKLNLALFRNQIFGYLIPTNTGEKEWGSGAVGWLWIYQYRGQDAILDGAELSVDAEIIPWLHAQVRMSYVRGTLATNELPVERIPPLNGKVALRYVTQPLNLHVTARFSDSQHRLGEFELPTDGYIAYDVGCQYMFSIWGLQHQTVFAIENILDTEYRQHLSRIKVVMPEPGRNVKFLYRIGY